MRSEFRWRARVVRRPFAYVAIGLPERLARLRSARMERLYRDEALWNRLSQAGIANVRRHFSPEAAAEPIGRVFEAARRKRSAAA